MARFESAAAASEKSLPLRIRVLVEPASFSFSPGGRTPCVHILSLSLPLSLFPSPPSLSGTHAHTHAHTHTRSHTRTHNRLEPRRGQTKAARARHHAAHTLSESTNKKHKTFPSHDVGPPDGGAPISTVLKRDKTKTYMKYTCMHTYIHTFIHECIHTPINTYI